MVEFIPSEKATAVVKDATIQEWLEGIPPVRQIRVERISPNVCFLERRSTIIVFIS